jgi:AraC-like DNA-binding protein
VPRAAKVVERPSPIDDPRGPLGIRLVPLVEGASFQLRTGAPTLLLPVDAGTARLLEQGVDRASLALLAPGASLSVETTSPVTHLLLLTVSPTLVARASKTYAPEIDESRLEAHLRTTRILPRTNWLNEVCHRYLFERAVCNKRDNDATRFLETEIVKELYFLSEADGARPSVVEREGPLLQRALAAIEARLFERDVVQRLPRACGASASTLLRAFKRELGQGPIGYVRKRRLDESLVLLKSRRYSVSEVATLVGYRNFAAFSQAFRARFGLRPSDVLSRWGEP